MPLLLDIEKRPPPQCFRNKDYPCLYDNKDQHVKYKIDK
jgi:hypothetical protein